jgi:hypothetical protein
MRVNSSLFNCYVQYIIWARVTTDQNYTYTGCLKIREFRIQSVVGKDPVELEKYLEKKIRSS